MKIFRQRKGKSSGQTNSVDYGGPYGWTDGNFFLGQKSFASVMISSDRARLGLLSQDVKK